MYHYQQQRSQWAKWALFGLSLSLTLYIISTICQIAQVTLYQTAIYIDSIFVFCVLFIN